MDEAGEEARAAVDSESEASAPSSDDDDDDDDDEGYTESKSKKKKKAAPKKRKRAASKSNRARKKVAAAKYRSSRVDDRPRQLKKLDADLWDTLVLHRDLVANTGSVAELCVVLDRIANTETSFIAVVSSRLGRHIAALTSHDDSNVAGKAAQIRDKWVAQLESHADKADLVTRLRAFDAVLGVAPTPAAAAASSISRPVRNRSRLKGALILCGSPVASVWAKTWPEPGVALKPP